MWLFGSTVVFFYDTLKQMMERLTDLRMAFSFGGSFRPCSFLKMFCMYRIVGRIPSLFCIYLFDTFALPGGV